MERALELQPENAETYFEFGRLYQENGQFEQAVQAYSGAIGLNPSEPAYYCQRATLNLQNARLGPAIRDYWAAFKLAPAWAKTLSLALIIVMGGAVAYLIRKKWKPSKGLPKT